MQERDHFHGKALKLNTSQHWNSYRKLKNTVNRLVKSAKSKYYCDKIDEAKGDSKKVWETVNEACKRNSKSQAAQCIISNGVQHSTPKSIASAMNSFFASIGRLLADKIPNTNLSCNRHNNLTVPQFYMSEVDEQFVLQQLLSLKPNKAIGLDKISARLLKSSAHTITSSVTKLLNLSIRTGRFPNLWKCSKITAFFKTADRTNTSHYRPISILPTLSKILEKVIHLQLYQHLVTNEILSNKQFGFRFNH
jgi:hypothetical protein